MVERPDPDHAAVESPDESTGPLDGLFVVDFSQAAAGPFCSQHLGDMGARVLKVEPPSGDMIRGWNDQELGGLGTYFMGLNRNKESIAIDLKTPQGASIARRLCDGADIVIENFRPGTMARFNLSYEEVAEVNPTVIYTSISAFGEQGPLAERPGMDIVIQAFAGIMGITGVEDGEPVKVGSPVADLATGYAAAMATLGALYSRAVKGEGQHVRLSMLNVVVSMISNHTTGFLLNGSPVGRLGSAHPQLVPYQAFETADGEHLIVGILNERFWTKFCDAIDRPDLEVDPRFATNRDRVQNRAELLEILGQVLKEKTCSEWEDVFLALDVPNTRVNSLESLFAHPQVEADEVVVEIDHPIIGPIPTIAQPSRFERTPATYRLPPPQLGEHTRVVLRELGMTEGEIEELSRAGVVTWPGLADGYGGGVGGSESATEGAA